MDNYEVSLQVLWRDNDDSEEITKMNVTDFLGQLKFIYLFFISENRHFYRDRKGGESRQGRTLLKKGGGNSRER